MKIKNLKLKIVFFGSSKFVIPIIEVIKNNFNLSLVITTEKQPDDPVISYCIKSKVYHYVVIDFRDKQALQELTKLNADVGVLASFGSIIPNDILDIFPYGIINIHPSLLPKYRGPTPVQAAILNGDKKTGATIIKLDEYVDHGPIIVQKEVTILPTDTTESLSNRLFRIGSELLPQVLSEHITGKLKPKEQNHKNATFTKKLSRQDGFIDIINLPPPQTLERMIRAYYPWPGAWTKYQISNIKYQIVKFLPDKKIQVEGKKPVRYKDFLNGYPGAKDLIEKLNPLSV